MRAKVSGVLVAAAALLTVSCTDEPPDPGPPPPIDVVPSGVLVTPTGVVAPILDQFDGGYWVRTPCYAVVSVRGGERVDHVTVVIDPGHGGDELGAPAASGLLEKDVNREVADALVEELRAHGVDAMLTRTGDERMTIRTRAEIAAALEPAVFVSIHHDSAHELNSPFPGAQAIHQMGSPRSRRLAQMIHSEVFTAFSDYDVPWVSHAQPGVGWRPGDDGDYYGLLRLTVGVPAVISEGAFMSNPPEAALLATEDFQRVEAKALADGIVRYLSVDPVPANTPEPNRRPLPDGTAADADGCVDPPMQ